MIFTSDNNCGKRIEDGIALDNLRQIAGRRISDLVSAVGNEVWLFPREKDRYGDKIENKSVFTIEGNILTTENIMGFIGCGGTEITIHSRFSSDYERDYFMQYLLQKVFAINIFDLNHSRSEENALDIAVLLFPYFLQKALLQGLFREYQRINYNDDRVKGTIDFNRHIKMNYPFLNGKVSYSTKEFRYDNPITQLIRHTIEYIRSKRKSSYILFASQEIKDYVQVIIDATPSYRKGDLAKVVSQNIRPISHPYYSEYRPLQRLCLQILRHERISYGRDSEKIHGVLFDGAWLWEEYLSITLKKVGFMHPQNKTKSGGIPVYLSGRGTLRYPDYIHPSIIADAKYKRLYRAPEEEVSLGIPRDDLNQMITYLHITGKNIGVFICPRDDFEYPSENGEPIPEDGWNLMYHRVGVLCGLGGEIHVISVNIPQTCDSFKTFNCRMESIEASLERKLSKVLSGEDESQVISYA
jgi:5-methylcytosine-specific restriction endonuclease McrBC regulatory subunit McrC